MSAVASEGIELGIHTTKRAVRALSSVCRILYGRVRVEDILQFLGSRCMCDSFYLKLRLYNVRMKYILVQT
jgi:hypothetical protein